MKHTVRSPTPANKEEEDVQRSSACTTTTIHAQAHSTARLDVDVTREQFDDDAHTAHSQCDDVDNTA